MQNHHVVLTYVNVNESIPTILIKSPTNVNDQSPVIVLMHGLFGGKERNILYGASLAEKGFLVALPDAYLHGERWEEESLYKRIFANFPQAMQDVLVRTTSDISLVVDYLSTLDYVNIKKIGITGISMGGMLTFAAAIKESRFKAFAPIIGTGDYYELFSKGTLPSDIGFTRPSFTHEQYLSTFKKIQELDPILHAKAFKDKPILIQNGLNDKLIPINAIRNTVRAIETEYSKSDVIKYIEYPGIEHELTDEMVEQAVVFFQKNL